jgi:hypothetical protein
VHARALEREQEEPDLVHALREEATRLAVGITFKRSLADDRRLEKRNSEMIEELLRENMPAYIHTLVRIIAGYMHYHTLV